MWRLVLSDKLTASLHELETVYSLDDAADAHDALDWFDAVELDAQRRAEAQNSMR